MKRKNSFLILCCCGIAATLVAFTAFAATVYVPTDEANIEAGINAVVAAGVPGTVLVEPGIWAGIGNRLLVVPDQVTVQSTAGPYTTTIDCDGVPYAFTFTAGQGPSAVVSGLTIIDASNAPILCNNASSPTINNCIMKWNQTGADAGGIVAENGSSPTITGCEIRNNVDTDVGGIAAFSGSSPTISGTSITYNSANNVGGIYSEDSSPNIINCTIEHNQADVDLNGWPATGGAIFVGGSPTITGSSVSYNGGWPPPASVGGIFNANSLASLTISGSVISFNSAWYTGGIEVRDASPTISNSTISQNWGFGTGGDWNWFTGGMAFWGDCSPTISGNTVSYNSAIGTGGIMCNSNGEVTESPAISGGTVSFNSAWLIGGINLTDTSGTITGVDVSQNRAGFVGGMGFDLASVSVTNSIISDNSGWEVAGIGCSNSEILLTNCTIANNASTDAESGIGGIGSPDDTAITVLNSILWGNTPNQFDTGVPATVTYSDVQGGPVVAGNINADPMFMGAGDYHLTPVVSPCIDVGTAAGAPNDDIDGDFRPEGAGIDMGADEALPDDDGDGVPSVYEMGPPDAPNPGYDGNDDGIPDFMQGNVTSFPTVDGLNYVTITCPEPAFFTNVEAGPNPSPGNTPEGVTFPLGFFSFTINNVGPGGAVTVTLLLPTAPEDYWKYGRTPANPANHWYLFDYDGTTGAQKINSTTTTLDFVDGQRGDNDLLTNGKIVDPVGPAVQAPVAGVEDDDDEALFGDDSGCFIGTLANSL
jgi:hypothetical protein